MDRRQRRDTGGGGLLKTSRVGQHRAVQLGSREGDKNGTGRSTCGPRLIEWLKD